MPIEEIFIEDEQDRLIRTGDGGDDDGFNEWINSQND